jgi:hypothetical protein
MLPCSMPPLIIQNLVGKEFGKYKGTGPDAALVRLLLKLAAKDLPAGGAGDIDGTADQALVDGLHAFYKKKFGVNKYTDLDIIKPRSKEWDALVLEAKVAGLLPSGGSRPLTEVDYRQAANGLGCKVELLKQVVAGTFAPALNVGQTPSKLPGRPRIRFHADLFSRATAHRYDRTFPRVSGPAARPAIAHGEELDDLALAMALNREAAIRSTSWGLFRIPGSWHKACGFATATAMADAMFDSERKQLDAFVTVARKQGLDLLLARSDRVGYAQKYRHLEATLSAG